MGRLRKRGTKRTHEADEPESRQPVGGCLNLLIISFAAKGPKRCLKPQDAAMIGLEVGGKGGILLSLELEHTGVGRRATRNLIVGVRSPKVENLRLNEG